MIVFLLLLLSPDDYSEVLEFDGATATIAVYEVERQADGVHVSKIEFDKNGVWKSESYIDNIAKNNIRKTIGKLENEDFERFSQELLEIAGKVPISYTGAEPRGDKYLLQLIVFERGIQHIGLERSGISDSAERIRAKIEEITVVAYEKELVSKWEEAWKQARAGRAVAYKLKELNLGEGNIDVFLIDDKEYFIASAKNGNSNKYLNLGKVLQKMEHPPSDKARIEVRQKFYLDAGEFVLP
jgi:hypothetical protein